MWKGCIQRSHSDIRSSLKVHLSICEVPAPLVEGN
jgi:hypothetical protein